MPELELVEERLISGVGVLRVPEEVEDGRYYQLCIDVIRQVAQPFESFKYTPSRSRYCTLSFMRGGYVIDEQVSDYERRNFDFVSDISGQTLIAVQCMYKGLREILNNITVGLTLDPISLPDKIADYEHLNLFWDEVVITCEGTTAIQARLFVLEYADDCESSRRFRPPPPPPPLPRVPANTSIGSISRPYDEDEFTNRDPLDEFEEEPPLGEECAIYRVDYNYTTTGGASINAGFRIAGEYFEDLSFTIVSGQTQVRITARGTSGLAGTPTCGDLINRVGGTISSANINSVTLISVTPI